MRNDLVNIFCVSLFTLYQIIHNGYNEKKNEFNSFSGIIFITYYNMLSLMELNFIHLVIIVMKD